MTLGATGRKHVSILIVTRTAFGYYFGFHSLSTDVKIANIKTTNITINAIPEM